MVSYNHNLHRFFFLDVRNVGDACIALCTQRVDVDPVLPLHDDLRKTIAHIPILHIRQHALKHAEVHPCADALHQFYDFVSPFVITNVVGHDVEMLPFHLTPYYV